MTTLNLKIGGRDIGVDYEKTARLPQANASGIPRLEVCITGVNGLQDPEEITNLVRRKVQAAIHSHVGGGCQIIASWAVGPQKPRADFNPAEEIKTTQEEISDLLSGNSIQVEE